MPAPNIARPTTGDDSKVVLEHAVASLGTLRDLDWLGDATVTIHLLVSLIHQAEHDLTAAITHAKDQDHTWTTIAKALDTTTADARQRHPQHD